MASGPYVSGWYVKCPPSRYVYSVNLSTGLTCLLSRSLDLDIHPRRKAQLIEGLDRLRGGLHDIDQSLVGSNFELLSRLLVNRRSGQNRVSLDSRRQRDRSVNLGMRSLGSIYNVLSTLIQDRVIISLHSNSNYLARHSTSSSLIAVPPQRSTVSTGPDGGLLCTSPRNEPWANHRS